ncbi:DUF488 domain-containing protein [Arcticibacter eurypsychrophilus]|uniref:DUF488 domain-containing protein n=1 Tax=Arcticibacter eurypsychrophilus TaxID=1434752 RepID=UPI00084D0855|nr:DUF488 domain-containing protein [Arcticibacter eurypsychrophilus]
MTVINIKRAYKPAEKSDGFRILVDRLWPRGIKKEDAQLDEWMKEIAPSVALRKWFDHDPQKWEAFFKRYTTELEQNEAIDHLLRLINIHKSVTLIYGAKDEKHNHALVLALFLEESTKQ